MSNQTVTEIMARAMMRWDDPRYATSGLPSWESMAGDVLKALAAAGYVILPRVPTPAMLEAAKHVVWRFNNGSEEEGETDARDCYAAMLQAAEGQ